MGLSLTEGPALTQKWPLGARDLFRPPGRGLLARFWDVENGKDCRLGKACRIIFAAIDLTDNVQGEFSPHVIIVPESSAKDVVCAIKGAAHNAQGDGVIDLLAR